MGYVSSLEGNSNKFIKKNSAQSALAWQTLSLHAIELCSLLWRGDKIFDEAFLAAPGTKLMSQWCFYGQSISWEFPQEIHEIDVKQWQIHCESTCWYTDIVLYKGPPLGRKKYRSTSYHEGNPSQIIPSRGKSTANPCVTFLCIDMLFPKGLCTLED